MSSGAAGIAIRRMSCEDLERVMSIAHSVNEAPQWPRSAYLAALDPKASPRRIALVAAANNSGQVIGFAIASVLAPQAELESIAVVASEHRQGIGGMLMAALVEELRAAAVSEIMLEVRASNQRAISFYQVQGWQETGRRTRYYAHPQEDAVLMSLALG